MLLDFSPLFCPSLSRIFQVFSSLLMIEEAWMILLLYTIREGCCPVTFFQKIKAFFTKFWHVISNFQFSWKILCPLPCLYLDFEQLHFSIFIFIFDAATFDIFHYKFLWFSFPFAVSENTVIDIQAPGSPVVYGYVHIYLIHILDTISNYDDYVFWLIRYFEAWQ